MPAVARKNDSVATGHTCTGSTTIVGHSSNVNANNKGVSFKGASLAVHTILTPASPVPLCLPHVSNVNAGLNSVKVNGIAIARKTDSADLGSITGGSGDVNAGGI